MKNLGCFILGVVVGVVLAKKSLAEAPQPAARIGGE